jgi:hypothetical protein
MRHAHKCLRLKFSSKVAEESDRKRLEHVGNIDAALEKARKLLAVAEESGDISAQLRASHHVHRLLGMKQKFLPKPIIAMEAGNLDLSTNGGVAFAVSGLTEFFGTSDLHPWCKDSVPQKVGKILCEFQIMFYDRALVDAHSGEPVNEAQPEVSESKVAEVSESEEMCRQ